MLYTCSNSRGLSETQFSVCTLEFEYSLHPTESNQNIYTDLAEENQVKNIMCFL